MNKENNDNIARPIIFIGPGRSGSTIISECVFAHEDLAWLTHQQEHFPKQKWVNRYRRCLDNSWWRFQGEKSQVNRTRFLNGLFPRPAEAYAYWESVTDENTDFSRGYLLNHQASEVEKIRIRASISEIVKMQGKKRFSMKVTGPSRIEYLKSIFPDAYFIYVIRDPVSTVRSLLHTEFWQENGAKKLWWHGAYTDLELFEYQSRQSDPIWGTAFQLNKLLKVAEQEIERCHPQLLKVNYEEFIQSPMQTIQKICDFCELSDSEALKEKVFHLPVHDQNKRKSIMNPEIKEVVDSIFNKASISNKGAISYV